MFIGDAQVRQAIRNRAKDKPAEEPTVKRTCKMLPLCPVMGCDRLLIRVLTKVGWVAQEYDVEPTAHGYDLIHLDRDTFELVTYRVGTHRGFGLWTCSCPAARGREEACKHTAGLRAAMLKAPF